MHQTGWQLVFTEVKTNDHTSSSFNSISLPILDPFPSKLDNVQEEPFFMCINEHFEKCKKMLEGLDVKKCIIKSFRHCIYINRNDILRLYKMGVLRYDYCIEKHRTITGLQIVYLNGMKRVLKGIEMSFLHKILELAPNFIFVKYFPISIFLYENNVQIE